MQDFNDVIDSFINGQYKQMVDQFSDLDAYDFVQELQDCDYLNDKQKITILGRLLKANS